MSPDLFLNLVTRDPLLGDEAGVDLLRMLMALPPGVRPDRFNNYEPVNRPLGPEHVSEAIAAWKTYPFFWKRSRSPWEGAARADIGRIPKHGWLKFDGAIKGAPMETLIGLLQALAVRYEADLGFLQVLTPRETQLGALSRSVAATGADGSGAFICVPPILLRKYLPDLYWANVLGPAYLDLFGRNNVLSTPAAVVEPLRDDLVYLQLTKEITDVRDQPEVFEAARLAAKEHLGSDAFFDPRLGLDHSYSVPQFRLPSRIDST